MHVPKAAAVALLALATASCGGGGGGYGPSEQDINNSLEATLQSVSGDWTGLTNEANGIRLDFKLQETGNGQVSGMGTMKEANAPSTVPITVTGTFQRPLLSLTFEGMVYENRAVAASAQGSYITVGGIGSTLRITAPGYSRDMPILLQEK